MIYKACTSLEQLKVYDACLFLYMFVKVGAEVDGTNPKTADILSSVSVKPLPAKQQVKLSMPVGQVSTGKI